VRLCVCVCGFIYWCEIDDVRKYFTDMGIYIYTCIHIYIYIYIHVDPSLM